MKILWILGCLLAPVAAGIAWADPLLPVPVQQTLRQVKQLAEKQYSEESSIDNRDMASRQFSQAIDTLAAQVGSELAKRAAVHESDNIDAKLITIACCRKLHPDLYKELVTQYVQGGASNRHSRAYNTAYASVKHLQPEYRLLWEYLLLSPIPRGTPGSFHNRVTDTIARTHNEASLITIVFAFGLTVTPDAPPATMGYKVDTQTDALNTIGRMLGKQGLLAFMECLRLWHEKPHPHLRKDNLPTWENDELDIPRLIALELYDGFGKGRNEKWGKAIAEFQKQNVNREYATLFQEVQGIWFDIKAAKAQE